MNKILKYLKSKYLARKFIILIITIAIAVVVLYAKLIDGEQFIRLLISLLGFYSAHDTATTYIENKGKAAGNDGEDKQNEKEA